MEIIFILLPLSLLFAFIGLGAYIWSVRSGQFDDLETPPHRILFDDEDTKVENPEESKTTP